jgi:hypothetical protein
MGDILKVVLAEFSTLSWAVSLHKCPGYKQPLLELKTLPEFCPSSTNLQEKKVL